MPAVARNRAAKYLRYYDDTAARATQAAQAASSPPPPPNPMQEAMQERMREMFATAPDRVGSKNMSCLLRESLHGNAEAISDCGIPEELFPSAISCKSVPEFKGRTVFPLISLCFVQVYESSCVLPITLPILCYEADEQEEAVSSKLSAIPG